MANAAGFIQESIWRDSDWRRLSRNAQAMYMQLLSQKELDCAGLLPLQPNKWAKGCGQLTAEQVMNDLAELQDGRFIVFDTETDELLVRTYIRNSNVAKSPNMRRSAARSARLAASHRIRSVLAAELRNTGDDFCVDAADEIDPDGRVSEPFNKPFIEPFAEPFGKPSGVGEGEGVTHLASNSGGEETRPTCLTHPNGNPKDEPCWGCRRVREWDEKLAAKAEADELVKRRRQREIRDNCDLCDENGLIETKAGMRRCDHQSVAVNV